MQRSSLLMRGVLSERTEDSQTLSRCSAMNAANLGGTALPIMRAAPSMADAWNS